MRIESLNETTFENMRVDTDALLYNLDTIKSLIEEDALEDDEMDSLMNTIELIGKNQGGESDETEEVMDVPTEEAVVAPTETEVPTEVAEEDAVELAMESVTNEDELVEAVENILLLEEKRKRQTSKQKKAARKKYKIKARLNCKGNKTPQLSKPGGNSYACKPMDKERSKAQKKVKVRRRR